MLKVSIMFWFSVVVVYCTNRSLVLAYVFCFILNRYSTTCRQLHKGLYLFLLLLLFSLLLLLII